MESRQTIRPEVQKLYETLERLGTAGLKIEEAVHAFGISHDARKTIATQISRTYKNNDISLEEKLNKLKTFALEYAVATIKDGEEFGKYNQQKKIRDDLLDEFKKDIEEAFKPTDETVPGSQEYETKRSFLKSKAETLIKEREDYNAGTYADLVKSMQKYDDYWLTGAMCYSVGTFYQLQLRAKEQKELKDETAKATPTSSPYSSPVPSPQSPTRTLPRIEATPSPDITPPASPARLPKPIKMSPDKKKLKKKGQNRLPTSSSVPSYDTNPTYQISGSPFSHFQSSSNTASASTSSSSSSTAATSLTSSRRLFSSSSSSSSSST